LEEIAYKNKWIDKIQMLKIAEEYKNTEYGLYILSLLK
jgi:dTDP-glucose pyrophosphorylase